MYPANELGYHDVFGNAWEWAEDHFNGLNGYSSHWYYDDFSSPCFDGRHNLILVSTGKYMYLVLFKTSKGFQEICEVAMVLLPMPYFPLVPYLSRDLVVLYQIATINLFVKIKLH